MLARLSERLSALFRAVFPDPFVIAVLLTVVTVVLALMLADSSLRQVVDAWSGMGAGGGFGTGGVWALLKFSMQMCLILVTGHVLAASPPVSWLIDRLAALPRSGAQAAALVAFVAATLAVLNWGLGLIGGALMARRVGIAMDRRGIAVHYPLLAAAGYVGLMVWHGGLSGSAPLSSTTVEGLRSTLGAAAQGVDPIPLSRTLFAPYNIVITLGLLVIAPLVFARMHPKSQALIRPAHLYVSAAGHAGEHLPRLAHTDDRPGWLPRVLEETPIINVMLVALIGAWAWAYYVPADLSQSGLMNLGLDAVNLTMLMLGLLLNGTPRRFLGAVEEAAGGCAGIIIQFPLYAGIMGIMKETGLTALLANEIASTSSPRMLPMMTFAAASLINLFVPSGGGQWAVQGPIALEAARQLGVEPGRMVMSVAYGDQLTNMLQPFWALPLLAITGAKAREIVGYTAVVMAAGGLWMAAGILLL